MHSNDTNDRTHPDRIERPRWSAAPTDIELQRVIGAVLGGAVADALGAPFEFGPAGAYSERFPEPVLCGTGELIGGGAFQWSPGKFTDDTQMAVALAESIIDCDGFDADDVWGRFLAWRSAAADCGSLTAAALRQPDRQGAALSAHSRLGRSAANGALMRVVGLACAFTAGDESTLIAAARAQAALQCRRPQPSVPPAPSRLHPVSMPQISSVPPPCRRTGQWCRCVAPTAASPLEFPSPSGGPPGFDEVRAGTTQWWMQLGDAAAHVPLRRSAPWS